MRPKYLILGGLLLIAAALSLTAYNLWENQRATAAAQQALTAMKEQSEPKGTKSTEGLEAAIPEYVRNPNMEMPVVEIDGIEYIGTLEIPALEPGASSDQHLERRPAGLRPMPVCGLRLSG